MTEEDIREEKRISASRVGWEKDTECVQNMRL